MIHRILFNVCKRLFDERVKEWLLDRYIIVSGSFREIDGRVSLRCAGVSGNFASAEIGSFSFGRNRQN